MKKRVTELDYVRALSMLAIIALHVSSAFIFAESSFKLFGMNLAFIINQLARFSVPAFIVLSGISLSYGKADEPPMKFYSERMFKAVVPYLLWYAVYFAYNFYYAAGSGSAYEFFAGLLRGASAPHLYFMVVIIQLYILFPLLVRLLKRYKYPTLVFSFLISLYFQLGIQLRYFGQHIIPLAIESYAWLLFPTWIFYFTAGLLIANEKLTVLLKKAPKLLPATLAFSLLLGFLLAFQGKVDGTFELSIKPAFFTYTAVVFVFLFGLGGLCGKLQFLNKIALFLSKRSMTVYFIHILILYIFRMNGIFQRGISGMLLLLLSVTVLSIASAALIDSLISVFARGAKSSRVTSGSRKS